MSYQQETVGGGATFYWHAMYILLLFSSEDPDFFI